METVWATKKHADEVDRIAYEICAIQHQGRDAHICCSYRSQGSQKHRVFDLEARVKGYTMAFAQSWGRSEMHLDLELTRCSEAGSNALEPLGFEPSKVDVMLFDNVKITS